MRHYNNYRVRFIKRNFCIILLAFLILVLVASYSTLKNKKQVNNEIQRIERIMVIQSGERIEINDISASFILPKELENLIYETRENGTLLLTTGELEKLDSKCNTGALGSLTRVYEEDLVSNNNSPWWERKDGLDDAVNQGDAVKLGDFYIYYYGPQDTCSGDASVTKRLFELKDKIPDLLRTARIEP